MFVLLKMLIEVGAKLHGILDLHLNTSANETKGVGRNKWTNQCWIQEFFVLLSSFLWLFEIFCNIFFKFNQVIRAERHELEYCWPGREKWLKQALTQETTWLKKEQHRVELGHRWPWELCYGAWALPCRIWETKQQF